MKIITSCGDEYPYFSAQEVNGIIMPDAIVNNERHGEIAKWDYENIIGFGIPSWEAIEAMKKLGNSWLDLGCGTGYWTYLARQRELDMLPVVKTKADHYGFVKRWVPDIVEMDAEEAVFAHPERNLLMSWPCLYPKGQSWAYRAIAVAQLGTIVAYATDVGDDRFTICGCPEFTHKLWHSGDFKHLESIKLPAWWGRNDHIHFFRKVIP
jgi:hypothetical protein